MNELALFAGAGGGLLGSILLGWKTICAVEKEAYCREIILRRQRDGVLPLFPIWDDIKTFDGRPWRGKVDVVSAGFPCQPWSSSVPKKGKSDKKERWPGAFKRNLWPDTIRIIREVGPEYALLENVPHLVSNDYFGQIIGSLAESGFDAEWDVVSAAEVGAPHERERVWVVGHNNGTRPPQKRSTFQQKEFSAGCWWAVEPALGRVAHGLAHRMDRIKALGNGQVPAVVEKAWKILTR